MKRLLILSLLFSSLLSSAQTSDTSSQPELGRTANDSLSYRELGIPYMQHYEAKDYDARPDNQSLLQGDNGLMYFGNGKGVLEFDGIDWRLIQLPNQGLAMTMTKNADGKIFVGGFNELGYLEPDSLGFTAFRSIKTKLDSIYDDFGYLGFSFAVNNDIYFQARKHLFRWSNETFKVWSSENMLLHSSAVNGTVYLQEHKKGLLKLENDEFQLITPVTYHISEILSFDKENLLVATRKNGFFFLKDNALVPFSTAMDDYIKEHTIVTCKIMPNGWITIGTHTGGLVVMDQKGLLVHLLDTTTGLLDNFILRQELDNQGALWLALTKGISRVELLSPFTIFDERLGVKSFVNRIMRYQGEIFVASHEGFLHLKADKKTKKNSFERIENTDAALYLLEVEESLLMASSDGVVLYDGGNMKQISKQRGGALLQSKIDPSIVYVGLGDGLTVLKKQGDVWQDLGKIDGIDDDIREIVELADGKIWMESQIDGVWLVDFYTGDTLNLINPVIKRFKANKELPSGWLFLHFLRGEAIFQIEGTIYKYDEQLDSIIPYDSFGEPFGFKGDVVPQLEDSNGNLWMRAQLSGLKDEEKQRTVSIPQIDGTYKVKHIDDRRIVQDARKALLPEESGILWYGGQDGVIIRQDLNYNMLPVENFNALIRKISINLDSTVFGGLRTSEEPLAWNFENNTLRFEYASPSYDEISKNEYQYYLEGFDENWSDWTKETKKDYTQIPEGDYKFKVKAKNIYEQVSEEASYAFTILAPWYRAWWAYLIYVLLFFGLLYLILQWRSRQLKAKNEASGKVNCC